MDNIGQMGWMHPDGDLPPKSDWLDDDRLKEWQTMCEGLRKNKPDDPYG